MSTPLPSRGKRIAFTAIALAIPLVTLLAAVAVYGWTVTAPYVEHRVRHEGDHDIAFDRQLGFVRPPDATTRRIQRGIDYTIHTDRLGARVNRAGDQTPARVDILTVGCSFSEGHGFANESTFTELLGRQLRVPVANFAVGSYGGVQSALALERHAGLRPKVVVYGLIEDHLRRNLDPCALSFFPVCLRVPTVTGIEEGQPAFTEVEGNGLAGVDLTGDLVALHEHPGLVNRSLLGLRTAWHEYRDWRAPAVVEATTRINDANALQGEIYVIRRLAAATERLGATLVVLHMPRVDGLPADDTSRGWKPLPRALVDAVPPGVVWIETAPRIAAHYAKHPEQPLFLTAHDDHPNARAHRLFATMLQHQIVARGLLAPAGGP